MGSLENIQRTADLISVWREIGDATAVGLELDNEVDSILAQVAEIGFEFATVSLVDDYRKVVETFRGWNVPSGWIKRAWHDLDSDDIQADVVRKKETQRIDGWEEDDRVDDPPVDDRLDRVIFERFRHKSLSRVWVPILHGDEVVGTIEAGCAFSHSNKVLTAENRAAVEKIGRDRGPDVARKRTFVLLKAIAEKAREVMGADLASVHVFHAVELPLEPSPKSPSKPMPLLMAGAGIDPDALLCIFRPDSAGMENDEPLIYPSDGRAISAEMCSWKVRSVAAFPLSLGGEAKGVLSLYFFGDRPVGADGLELGKVFARQAEVAIRNCLLMKNLAAAAGLAWNLSRFQSVIQAVASGQNLEQVLTEVARNVLYMLDADCVTLFQYNAHDKLFGGTPVTEGFFYYKDGVSSPTRPDDILWEMIKQQQPQFISEVSRNRLLAGAGGGAHRYGSRFIEREKIESCAALVLKAGGQEDEAVGCMFVNYRTRTDFSAEDKRVISALASSAAIAIHTARLHDQVERSLDGRLQRQVKSLQALIDIVARNRDVESDLNTTLRMLLAGVTAGQGVGFSRAMLFLTIGDRLKGKMATGAISQEEADDIWNRVNGETSTDFAAVLDDAAKYSADIKMGGNDSRLSLAVRGTFIPLNDASGAPARCVLSGRAVLVDKGQDDPFRERLIELGIHDNRDSAFVCVPLIESGERGGRPIGVLMCDNRFLVNEGSIDPDCIRDLEAFAAVAAMTIENDRLRKDMAERQEFENWRFAVNASRHRLRATVDVIYHRVKEIAANLRLHPGAGMAGAATDAIEKDLERLGKEITRVKVTLAEFGRFSLPKKPDLCPLDLVELIRDVSDLSPQSNCEIHHELPKQAMIAGDRRLLADVFDELIKNSCDAMAGDNEGRPKTITITASLEASLDGNTEVVVEFADTGRGINGELGTEKNWIFTPFKTTKEDTGGNGLGLAIVVQDIRAHNGTITIKETGMPGVCFELRIPAIESGS